MQGVRSFSFGVHCSENELSGDLKVFEQQGACPVPRVLSPWSPLDSVSQKVIFWVVSEVYDHSVSCVSTRQSDLMCEVPKLVWVSSLKFMVFYLYGDLYWVSEVCKSALVSSHSMLILWTGCEVFQLFGGLCSGCDVSEFFGGLCHRFEVSEVFWVCIIGVRSQNSVGILVPGWEDAELFWSLCLGCEVCQLFQGLCVCKVSEFISCLILSTDCGWGPWAPWGPLRLYTVLCLGCKIYLLFGGLIPGCEFCGFQGVWVQGVNSLSSFIEGGCLCKCFEDSKL